MNWGHKISNYLFKFNHLMDPSMELQFKIYKTILKQKTGSRKTLPTAYCLLSTFFISPARAGLWRARCYAQGKYPEQSLHVQAHCGPILRAIPRGLDIYR